MLALHRLLVAAALCADGGLTAAAQDVPARRPRSADSLSFGPIARAILLDSLPSGAMGLIIRAPGKEDVILLSRRHFTPDVIHRANRQLQVVRALTGERASTAAMYRVELRPGGRDPDEGLRSTQAGRKQFEDEMYAARVVAGTLPNGQRHSHPSFGEGPSIEFWVKRVQVAPKSP